MLADLLNPGSGQATSLRAADFKITAGGSAAGGLGGLADAVSALVGGSGSDPWHESVWRIRVECGCAPFADRAEIDLAPGGPETALEDELNVELGYTDTGTTPVFTGKVWSIREIASGSLRLTLTNASHQMSVRRVNMTFQQSSAADAARQLASDAEVSTGNLGGRITMPAFVADDRSSAWRHVATLAQWEGMIAWIDAENTLQWNSVETAGPVHQFVYGDDLISIEKVSGLGPEISRRWQGEGAAGSNGSEAWSWLVKKADSLGSGGDVQASLVDFQGAFRSSEAVQRAASGYPGLPPCAGDRFMIRAAGVPAAAVGSTVSVTGTPDQKFNCTGVVIHVRHVLTKVHGFRTHLEVITPGGGAGGLSAGGLL